MDGINILKNNHSINIDDQCKQCYDNNKCKNLYIIYSIAIIIWVLIIYLFKIYTLPYYLLLFIPIFLFCFTMYNSSGINIEVESEIGRIIYFPMLIVVIINMYNWINKDNNIYKDQLSNCIFIALISLLLSSVDLWTHKKWIYTIRHISSILETYTIFLLIYVIIVYGSSRKEFI